MLDRLYEYLILKYFNDEKIEKEKFKDELRPFLGYLNEIENLEEIDITKFNRNLWEVVKRWRESYIHYRNSVATIYQQPPQQKVIKLPEETKKVIEESLKESIQKKLK
jgi:Asp-tRNA(Asn)/Glu-tRNA(Gln) amidotransferase C subunit